MKKQNNDNQNLLLAIIICAALIVTAAYILAKRPINIEQTVTPYSQQESQEELDSNNPDTIDTELNKITPPPPPPPSY